MPASVKTHSITIQTYSRLIAIQLLCTVKQRLSCRIHFFSTEQS